MNITLTSTEAAAVLQALKSQQARVRETAALSDDAEAGLKEVDVLKLCPAAPRICVRKRNNSVC